MQTNEVFLSSITSILFNFCDTQEDKMFENFCKKLYMTSLHTNTRKRRSAYENTTNALLKGKAVIQ